MSKVLITGKLHPVAIESFQANPNLQVVYKPDMKREELLESLQGVNVLVTRSETKVDQAVMSKAKDLKVVARAAVGVNNIDLEYATEKGILVINCPGKNTNSAAEMTLALLLGMFRNVPQAHHHMKNDGWDRHMFTGAELRGKSIGIVGLGNVGHRVAKFAKGFDMDVFAYDPYVSPNTFSRHHVKQTHSLDDLVATVDVLTVHTPLNHETKGLIGPELLGKMRKGSYVVNAARGGVVDEKALLNLLNNGHLTGAAIDTWEDEPEPMKELKHHERVLCSPHIGASTIEAQMAIGSTVYEQVTKAVDGGVVDYPVNLPKIGVIDDPLLKAYATLGEKLGRLAGQMIDFNPVQVELQYRGDLAQFDSTIVKLGFMKGFSAGIVDGYVSFVNAEKSFAKLGIETMEVKDAEFNSYQSALKVIIKGADEKALTVGGIVFDRTYLRLSLINDFYFEIEPNGTLLLMENLDRPGVIGDVGTFLAKSNINVDSFELSRNKKGGNAMAVIRIDHEIDQNQLKQLAATKNVLSVKEINL